MASNACVFMYFAQLLCPLPHQAGHFAPGQPVVLPYQQMAAGLPRGEQH